MLKHLVKRWKSLWLMRIYVFLISRDIYKKNKLITHNNKWEPLLLSFFLNLILVDWDLSCWLSGTLVTRWQEFHFSGSLCNVDRQNAITEEVTYCGTPHSYCILILRAESAGGWRTRQLMLLAAARGAQLYLSDGTEARTSLRGQVSTDGLTVDC